MKIARAFLFVLLVKLCYAINKNEELIHDEGVRRTSSAANNDIFANDENNTPVILPLEEKEHTTESDTQQTEHTTVQNDANIEGMYG